MSRRRKSSQSTEQETGENYSWRGRWHRYDFKATWPSGLRRHVKAVVRKGASSNLAVVSYFCFSYLHPIVSDLLTHFDFLSVKRYFWFTTRSALSIRDMLIPPTYVGGSQNAEMYR
jgi:hypothetical protein